MKLQIIIEFIWSVLQTLVHTNIQPYSHYYIHIVNIIRV